ncbi:MAG: hypothetical protein WBB01_12810 [Phormidesmis sp.]
MFATFPQGAAASTVPAADSAAGSLSALAPAPLSGGASGGAPVPPPPREQVRHLLFGTLSSINSTIAHLHALGYAEPNDWSRPISTGRPNEVMAILTRRIGAA